MADITHALIAALFTTFKGDFQAGLALAKSLYGEIATTVPSASASNTYGWLGEMPKLKEWVGDRVVQAISTHGYTVVNKDYEATIGIPRNAIEDDTVGVYKPVLQELGLSAATHPDELVFGLLGKGSTEVCYDGQYFFDTDHPVGVGTVSNITAGTETAWYLLDCSRPLKPIIFQDRKKPKLVSMTKEDDESVFTAKEYRYGVDARRNVGYGFWQMAHMSKLALDATSFNAAYAAMQSLKSAKDLPLGITPTHIVVPPTLRSAATKLVAETLENGGANPNANIVKVLVAPWL